MLLVFSENERRKTDGELRQGPSEEKALKSGLEWTGAARNSGGHPEIESRPARC